MANARREGRGGRLRRQSSGQAAVEYLTTYGWAIIIIAVALVALYIFVLAPPAVAPQQCLISSGASCTDILFGSNGTASRAVFVLTNTQQYPVTGPSFILNIQNKNVSGTCSPEYILPGGSILCTVALPMGFGQGSFVAGQLYLSMATCVRGTNALSCSGSTQQTYTGMMTTHAQPILSSNTVSISLQAMNASQTANGAQDPLIATVRLLGYPYQGASVIFSSSQPFATISPAQVASDTTGSAHSYVASNTTGNTIVTATFGGYSANTNIAFLPAVYITFTSNAIACPACIALVLDGNTYTEQQFPLTKAVGYGTRHVYAFTSNITGSGSTEGWRDVLPSAAGCGGSGQNNTFIATFNCTVNATYTLQYYLTEYAQAADGSVSPGSGWQDSGATVPISTSMYTPPAQTQYLWECWAGSGSVSSSSCSTSSSITMDGPITEVAQYITQYYLTLSSQEPNCTVTTSPGWYDSGNTVTLSAYTNTPPSGTEYIETGWSGTPYTGPNNPQQIMMNAPSNEQAGCTTDYYLTMNIYPYSAAGYTQVNGGSPNGSGWYQQGTTESLAATANGGYQFNSWSGGNNAGQVTMDGPQTVTADFYIELSLNAYPSAGGSESGAGYYAYDTSPSISASPNSGYQFDSWTGASGGQSTSVTITSPTTVTANYDPCITVTGDPSGAGTESGSGCYQYNSQASISASPNSGYGFYEWSGASGGSSTSVTVTAPATIVAIYDWTACLTTIVYGYSDSSQWPPGVKATNGAGNSYQCYTVSPVSGESINLVSSTQGSKYQFQQWTCYGNAGGTCYSGYVQSPAPAFTLYNNTVETAYIYPEVVVSPCANGDSYEITSGSHAGQYFTCYGPGQATDGSGNNNDYFSPGSTVNLRASGGSGVFAGWAALNDTGYAYSISCNENVNGAFSLVTYTEVRAYWCKSGSTNCYPC